MTTAWPRPYQAATSRGRERAVGAGVPGDEVAERVAAPARGRRRARRPAATTPSASRSRAASSMAAQRSSPATRTRITCREPSSSTSQCPTTPGVGGLLGHARRPPRGAAGRARGAGRRRPRRRGSAAESSSRCSSASVRATASGSSRSRRLSPSPRPSSSASRVGSSDEGRGAALGERRVALVEVLRDVAEDERPGERRRLARSRRRPVVTSRDRIRVISSTRPGHVEDVLDALAHRLEDDRERGVLAGHLEQLGRPLPLLPQRPGGGRGGAAAAAGPAPRTRGTAPRTAPTRRSAGDQVVHVVGLERDQLDISSASAPAPSSSNSRSGSRNTMPSSPCIACTSTPNRSRIRADTHSAHGACTWRPERRQHRHPPVAELVAEPLDDDGPVARQWRVACFCSSR